MFFPKVALLAAAATSALAADQVVAYWGNGGYTAADGNLADWCGTNEHIDIIILAFLSKFGNGNYPQGSLGYCTVNGDGSSSGCDQLTKDIKTCQSLGKKIFLSLGGAQEDGSIGYKLTSKGDAEGVAYSLWNSYGSPDHVAGGNNPRPLGDIRIDGWDIDLEADPGREDENGYLADMINSLRSRAKADPNHTYYISGAPQCPHPDANMNNSIQNSQYDYLFIQFYNNNCAATDVYKNSNDNPDGAGYFNFNEWPGVIANGASKNAKLYVGLPGNTAEAGDYFYVETTNIPKVYNAAKSVKGFSGFMVYEVGDTKSVGVKNGCDYFQHLHSVMTTGKSCGQ